MHGLRAQHYAEAYPVNPSEYRYQNDPQPLQETDQKPSVFEQLEQQQQRGQELSNKLNPDVEMKEQPKKSIFEILEEQAQQQERDRKGVDPER